MMALFNLFNARFRVGNVKNPAWYCAETAVNRLATSITQLTLSQVATDEIDAASKLLEGMSEAPRYPKHPTSENRGP